MSTINEVMATIEPKLQCGSLRLCATGRPARGNTPPAVIIGVLGGANALAAASDDDILLAMRNATLIGDLLRRELPSHWEVRQ